MIKSLADAFHLPPETLLEHAGLLQEEPSSESTEAVIRADSRLTEAQKEALLVVYRSFSPDS